MAAANPHTVVVIDAGAPVTMPWLGQVAAVVDAWYPGESNGTALATVLFGPADPSGHLPVTFPRSLSQVPASTPAQFPGVGGQVQYSEGIDVGYRWYDAQNQTPLFPFGYGLSYTSFAFSDLRVTPRRSSAGRGCSRSARSRRPGHQHRARWRAPRWPSCTWATRRRRASRRASSRDSRRSPCGRASPPTVRFTLDGHDLSYWNDAANGWVVPAGGFRRLRRRLLGPVRPAAARRLHGDGRQLTAG